MEKNLQVNVDQAAVLAGQQGNALINIILLILVTGAFSGWAAYLAQPRADPTTGDATAPASWMVFVVMGVVAAACVPLFLSILKSQLVLQIFSEPRGAISLDNYLIFAGLCVVAGFSSRRFIETVTEQLLRKVNQAQRDASEAKAEASEAAVVANEAISEIEGADLTESAITPELQQAMEADDESPSGGSLRLTAEQRRVLLAMTGKSYRTASGIAQDSGVPRHRISDLLEALADQQLVLPTKSRRTGGARWALSRRGAEALQQP